MDCVKNGEVLKPGQIIRPVMGEATAVELVERLYGFSVTSIKELNSYDDKNYFVSVSSHHQNPYEKDVNPDGYVLKVLNSLDSPKQHVTAEHEIQALLRAKGVNCQRPVLGLDGSDQHLERIYYTSNQDKEKSAVESGLHLVRLMTYIPGRLLVEVPYKPQLLYNTGKFVGALDKCLEGYTHESINTKSVWILSCLPLLRHFVFAVEREEDRNLVLQVIKAFEEEVVPLYPHFKRVAIHGDCNDHNTLVKACPGQDNLSDADKEYTVHAMLDFGDTHISYHVFEIAIHIMYLMIGSTLIDPLDVGGHALAGYLEHQELNKEEFDSLKVCIAGRFCQSLVMGAYSYHQDPGNEYLLATVKHWPVFHRFWNYPKEELYIKWRNIISSYDKLSVYSLSDC